MKASVATIPYDTAMWTTPPSLLERLRQSPEQEAWERFVDMYTPLMFAWTRRLGLSDHDAADLVQDLFAILVEKLPHFHLEAGKSFRAWLKTVLCNRWRNWKRKQAAAKVAADDGVLQMVAGPPETDPLEDAEYYRYLLRRAFDLIKDEFPESTWKACWEYLVLGRPPAEVAAEMHLSLNSVYLAKSRILRRLRDELAGLLD